MNSFDTNLQCEDIEEFHDYLWRLDQIQRDEIAAMNTPEPEYTDADEKWYLHLRKLSTPRTDEQACTESDD